MTALRKALLESYQAGNFLETVYASSRVEAEGRNDLALELAALHNEGLVDVIEAFQDLKERSSSGLDFFLTRHVFEMALPHFNASVPSVMRCVLQLFRDAGQDMMAGSILEGYKGFCAQDPSRPRRALKEIEANPIVFSDLLVATVSAGSRIDIAEYLMVAIRLCADSNIELRRQAVYSIGRLNWPEGSLVDDSAISALERSAEEETDDHLLAGVIKSAFTLFQKDRAREGRIVALIDKALPKGDEFALYAAAETFGFYTTEIPASLLDALLPHLLRVKPINKGTLDKIDYGIANLLKKGDSEQGICFLKDILLAHPDELTLKTFDSAALAIHSDMKLFSKILTGWLLRGEAVLCEGIHTMVAAHHGDNLTLHIDPVELTPADMTHFVFVARKALGYLLFQPVSAASLIISLMQHAQDDQTLQELGALLFDPLLINYTGSAREYVAQQSEHESGKVKETMDNALKAIDDYLETLRSIGNLPALHPREAEREAYHRNFSRTMTESLKAAEAQSPFMSIVSKSILLYGRKSIDYIYAGDGPPHRTETALKSHGTQFEHPRMEHIDPYGLDYMLRVFRMERFRA